MPRRTPVVLLLLPALLAACGGEDGPTTTERPIEGRAVVKRIDAAIRDAVTGTAQTHDGSAEYSWDLAKPGRLLVISHETGVESRQIGNVVYQRARGTQAWVRQPFTKPIRPVPELRLFDGRNAVEVSEDGTVVEYAVEVPARLVDGRTEDPGQGDELTVTIFVDEQGLPVRTRIEGNNLEGEAFRDWGEPVDIAKPRRSYLKPQG
jgi:hypothetical protein